MLAMSGPGVSFLLINIVLLLALPRRWAPLPLLVAACYMTLAQGLKLGPFHFTIIRLLVAVGIARVIFRGERLADGVNKLDWLMIIWACWTVISSFFHNDPSDALVFRLGIVYNTCGIYFLTRCFCQSIDDVSGLCSIIALLLVPVACEMVWEKLLTYNFFSILGGVPELPAIREGHIRAQGPFAHPILAGTVGATSLPLMVGIWKQNRSVSIAGIIACLAMVVTSRSSGPLASALVAIGGLFMWRYRHQMRFVRRFAVLGYITLDLVMKVPPYYLLGRFDLAGGSTGWHRAELIDSALRHLDEWWLAGTDYTRHWMPTGVTWNPNHTDITNHYIQMGVWGGLLSMLLFIAILVKGFSMVGQTLMLARELTSSLQFMVWSLGASLFAHAATSISVSYFDQSFLFLYLTLSAISSTFSWVSATQIEQEEITVEAVTP